MSKNKKLQYIFLIGWGTLRLAAPFTIWIQPFLGYWFNFLLDAFDGDISQRLKISQKRYQTWDKVLDLWLYVVMGYFVISQSALFSAVIYKTLLVLLAWRMIGQILYFIKNEDWVLFLFANIFTELFWVWFLIPGIFNLQIFGWFGPWFGILLVIIFSQIKEWFYHLAHLDFTNFFTHKKVMWK